MGGRDPLTIALVAVACYALGVGGVLTLGLRDTPQALASSFERGRPDALVAPGGGRVEFVVESGASAAAIAGQLEEAGVIESGRHFGVLLGYVGGGSELHAGRYCLPQRAPVAEVIRRLGAGQTAEDLVPIPEGLRLEEVGDVLERHGVTTREAWQAALEVPRDTALLADRPEGASLLGYLMPAAYPRGCERPPTADELVELMLHALEDQVGDELRVGAEATGHSVHELLTLASIVEKEAIVPDEQATIASVLYNRIEIGLALQMDPTVQFAVASETGGKRGWWPEVFVPDFALDSPYNTYLYPGLPPGPIANPGLGAIRAVIEPAQTEYLYFVARCDGSERHEFAPTLEEHEANVARCHG